MSGALGAGGLVTCQTYHLSAFSTWDVDVTSNLNTVDLIGDYAVLGAVSRGFTLGWRFIMQCSGSSSVPFTLSTFTSTRQIHGETRVNENIDRNIGSINCVVNHSRCPEAIYVDLYDRLCSD